MDTDMYMRLDEALSALSYCNGKAANADLSEYENIIKNIAQQVKVLENTVAFQHSNKEYVRKLEEMRKA